MQKISKVTKQLVRLTVKENEVLRDIKLMLHLEMNLTLSEIQLKIHEARNVIHFLIASQ